MRCIYISTYFLLSWFSQVQVVKNPPAKAGDARDMGSIPESGRFPGKGNDKPLQYSCLENSKDRGDWQATVHGVTKRQTWLRDWAHMHVISTLFSFSFPSYGKFIFWVIFLILPIVWTLWNLWLKNNNNNTRSNSFLKNYLFYYYYLLFWLHWVFVALHGLSLVVASGAYTLVVVCGLLTVMASLVEHRL